MPLVYRAVLSDSDGAITRAVEPLFEQWLKDKRLVGEEFRLAPEMSAPLREAENPAWLQHHHAPGRRKGDDGVHRLRLIEESEEQRWITTVTWRRLQSQQQVLDLATGLRAEQLSLTDDEGWSSSSWAWIDLEHEPSGGRPVSRPGSPRIVRSLMAAGEAHDGSLPLTAEPFKITAQHVSELVGYLRDPRRRVPVAVFAHDAKRAYDQADLARRLARDLAGVAAVFVLTDPIATQALAEALPPDFAVYGGALRTYLPGALSEDDTPTRHRVLGRVSLAALGPRAFPALKDQVLQLSARRPPPVDGFAVRRGVPATTIPTQTQTQTQTPPPSPAPAASPAPAPAAAPAPAPAQREAVDDASPLPWFARQVRRIKQALGANDTARVDSLPEAQESLANAVDELIQRLSRTGSDKDEATSTQQYELEERLRASDEDRVVLETLFNEASDESKETQRLLADLREDHELLQVELADNLRSSDRLRRRSRWLARQTTTTVEDPAAEDFTEVPASVAEVVALARERLQHLVVGAVDQDAAELDVQPGASLYAAKTWDALLALDSYAGARSSGAFSGGFRQWCMEPPDDGIAISARAVAMNESETVETTPALRTKRVFRVPAQVSADGRQYMPAHVKLVKRGEAAPRLYFHDDSGGATSKVYVGYVGRHLPTARFD